MMGFLEPAWQEKERVSEKHLEAGHGGRLMALTVWSDCDQIYRIVLN